MSASKTRIICHLVMRASLAFVLGWFGTQQLRNPDAWTDFIPGIVVEYSPLGGATLVLLHGFLLTMAGCGIFLGIACTAASWLASALLLEVTIALVLANGSAPLVVRDIGLLGLALALALDPARFLQLEQAPWVQQSLARPARLWRSLLGQRSGRPSGTLE